MEDIRKTVLILKELARCSDMEDVRRLKRKFADLQSEQDMEKYGILSLDPLIEHTANLLNEVKGLSKDDKLPKRIHLDVCEGTKGEILPTSKLAGEATAIRNMEKIYDLIKGEVTKIGVYGMGGIGKTTVMKHINNLILEGKNDKFDCVIWVTVSKESSIFNLQRDIACKLDVNLSKYEDLTTRAGAIFKALKQRGRSLLILDDLWEGYPLEDVGIPDPDDPTTSNICKLVLTTRSLDVCQSMKCEVVKMDHLLEGEAWSLFLHHVGHDVLQFKDLETTIMGVASECARLPLAISIIGRSMAGKREACDWRDALAKLRAFSKEPVDKGKRVIEQLQFSYDRLESKSLQKCLLLCALYPEDEEIRRTELVELLALEGIVEEKESKRDEIDEGNAMLNKLINQCLLEGGKTFKGFSCVKMHDLVRDMALQIDDLHSQYLAVSGIELRKPRHIKWSTDLLKIHISNCSSLNVPMMCPRLTTFILRNSSVQNIHDSFFQHFKALNVLSLFGVHRLQVLPDSISNLVNLVGLFLGNCLSLRYVPTLARLKNLRSLDISFTSMRDVPEGLEELSNLTYLNIFSSRIKVLPPEIIVRLSNLRYLVYGLSTKVRASALMGLKNLEMLCGGFHDIHNLRDFVRHIEEEGSPLTFYMIEVAIFSSYDTFDWLSGSHPFDKYVKLLDCTLGILNDLYLLPKDVKVLIMENVSDLTSLCTVASLNHSTDLRLCLIDSCKGVRELVSASSSSSFALQSLQTLRLRNLENLEALIGRNKVPCNTCNVFSCLQELVISRCDEIKVLFNVGLLSNLEKLEKLRVTECCQLEEIIEESMDDDKDISEAITCITLPKLSYLCLGGLENLKFICPPTRPLICSILKEIQIEYCPKLKQLVYAPSDDNGQPSPPPSLCPIELKSNNKRADELRRRVNHSIHLSSTNKGLD